LIAGYRHRRARLPPPDEYTSCSARTDAISGLGAGDQSNLDDCVAGAEQTKEAAVSFCERVARWRHGWPTPEPKRDLRKEVEQAFADEGVPTVNMH
jgi:hypothetical protein